VRCIHRLEKRHRLVSSLAAAPLCVNERHRQSRHQTKKFDEVLSHVSQFIFLRESRFYTAQEFTLLLINGIDVTILSGRG